MSHVMTKAEFEKLSPFDKGYAVYALGARDDQPNVPETYRPTPEERDEYVRGGVIACQDTQDVEG